MRILFDQGVPLPLGVELSAHIITTAFEQGWGALKNGDLLERAEATGFEVFVTTDQNLRYQQNLRSRAVAIVVLKTTSWPRISKVLPAVAGAINSVAPGGYVEVLVP